MKAQRLSPCALPLLATMLAGMATPALAQMSCAQLGTCAPGIGGNPTPRVELDPNAGVGQHRYVQPDQNLDFRVPKFSPSPRAPGPRPSGTRTIYRVEGLSADHVDWCYANYKNYRAKDNTFKPDKGPRRVCISPFS